MARLILYRRLNASGKNVGAGWHSAKKARLLRKQGYKMLKVKQPF